MGSDLDSPASGVGVARLSNSRRLARDLALRSLYASEIGGMRIQEAMDAVSEQMQALAPETMRFAKELALGVTANKARIGELIRAYLVSDWPIERLAVLDRLAIALATYELFDMPAIPPKVSISEAVALAKRYGDPESGRFVNGVLSGILGASPKADWRPDEASPEESGESDEPHEPEPDTEVEVVKEGSPEFEELRRAGGWRLRAPDEEL